MTREDVSALLAEVERLREDCEREGLQSQRYRDDPDFPAPGSLDAIHDWLRDDEPPQPIAHAIRVLLLHCSAAEAEIERLRAALVMAATPLEVLVMDEAANGPIGEISPSLRATIICGRDAVRAALAGETPKEASR